MVVHSGTLGEKAFVVNGSHRNGFSWFEEARHNVLFKCPRRNEQRVFFNECFSKTRLTASIMKGDWV